jgi:hypothetical protein
MVLMGKRWSGERAVVCRAEGVVEALEGRSRTVVVR